MDAAPCESAAPATKSILDLAKVLRLPRNLYLTLRKCCACHAIQTLRNLRAAVPMGPSPRPFRDRLRTGVAAEVVCAQSGSPIHAQRRFLHLAIPQLAESGRSTLRKCCACHEIDTRPCESAAPATKSILDLAKVLRLPRNSNLAKPSRGRANGPVSETVPRPPPYRRRSRGGLRTVRKPNSRTAPTFSASCHPPARRERTQHLAKVLRLPRNRYLTLRKRCACHEIYT